MLGGNWLMRAYDEVDRLERSLYDATMSGDDARAWACEKALEKAIDELNDFYDDPITRSISL